MSEETRQKLRPKLREAWESYEPEDFEHRVAELYESLGYEAEVTSFGGDGGVDVVLKKSGSTIYVQCKKYHASSKGSNKCTPDIAHKLLGVMTSKGIKEGKIVCSSGFTSGVQAFVDELKGERGINIELVGINEILAIDLAAIEKGLGGDRYASALAASEAEIRELKNQLKAKDELINELNSSNDQVPSDNPPPTPNEDQSSIESEIVDETEPQAIKVDSVCEEPRQYNYGCLVLAAIVIFLAVLCYVLN